MSTSVIKFVGDPAGTTSAARSASVEVALDTIDLDIKIPIGPRPGSSTIVVSSVVSEELQKIFDAGGRFRLQASGVYAGSEDSGFRETDIDWQDLWLAECLGAVSPSDPNDIAWRIEDNRRFTMGLTAHGVFNRDRVVNEFDELAAGNFGQFYRLNKIGYYTSTMRAAGALRFARFDAEEFEVWTALEGLRYMLTTWFDQRSDAAELPDGSPFKPFVLYDGDPELEIGEGGEGPGMENGYPLQNLKMTGPWWRVVATLCRLAHVSYAPDVRGRWRVFRVDPRAFPRKLGGYTGGGKVLARQRANLRSRDHRTLFVPRYDFRVDFEDSTVPSFAVPQTASTVDDAVEFAPIRAQNVVILPFDVVDPDSGEVVQAGTILTFAEAIRLWNAYPDVNYPPNFINTFGLLSLGLIRRMVHSRKLALALSNDARFKHTGGTHVHGSAIASTIYDFWHRLFQIDAAVRDHIRRPEAKTGNIASFRTGQRQPSRVYCDHTLVKTIYGAVQDGDEPVAGLGFHRMRAWPDGDTTKRLVDAQPADHFELRVQDPVNGLFILKRLTDIKGIYGDAILETFDIGPSNIVGRRVATSPAFLERCTPDPIWRATWLFSAELVTTRRANYFVVSKPGDEPPSPSEARGPVHEELVRKVNAGFRWSDENSRARVDEDTGELVLEGWEVYNRDRLEAIARSMRMEHYFELQDWVIGRFRALGFSPEVDRPQGNYGVGLRHSEGLFEAEYTAQAPRRRSIFETVGREGAALFYQIEEDDS